MTAVKRTRILLLVVGIAALAALVLMAGSLAQTNLGPGNPLPAVAHGTEIPVGLEGAAFHAGGMDLFLEIVYAVLLVLALASVVALIISPEMRKDFLRRLVLPALLLVYLLLIRDRAKTPAPPPTPGTAVTVEAGGGMSSEGVPTVVFDAEPPQGVVWGTRIAVGIASTLVLGGGLWLLWRSRRSPASRPLEQVAEQARQAIQAIEAGGDIRNAVLRCYFEMNRILGEKKGLVRQSTMTPREFERSLSAAGLPGTAVQQLTRLFEAVRYGAKPTGDEEEQRAVTALAAVADFCRSEV